MMRLPAVLLLLALPGMAAAAERLPSFPKNTPYASARASLIALGWSPVHMQGADQRTPSGRWSDVLFDPGYSGSDPTENAPASISSIRPDMDYPETSACSGSGRGNCKTVWRRADTLIEVGTVFDHPPVVVGVYCRAGCR